MSQPSRAGRRPTVETSNRRRRRDDRSPTVDTRTGSFAKSRALRPHVADLGHRSPVASVRRRADGEPALHQSAHLEMPGHPGGLSDAEGKSPCEVATFSKGTAALTLGDPEEKRRFWLTVKASVFGRPSTPLHRDAPSRGNKDRAA